MMDGKSGVPIARAERIDALDNLRGFALLGVFIVHMTTFGMAPVLATEAQIDALATARIDRIASFFVQWLVYDKANTLFAFLFGVGFWVQMTRIEQRGGRFEAIYLRRLAILLVFGLVHLFLLWPWDILHLYALAGFALFALRRMPIRAMLVVGVALALGGRLVVSTLFEITGVSGPAFEAAYSDAAIQSRQYAALSGSIGLWTIQMAKLMLLDWFASGLLFAWFLYALGRFLIGAVVARLQWIENAATMLPAYRRWLFRLLPAGLAGEAISALLSHADQPVIAPESTLTVVGGLVADIYQPVLIPEATLTMAGELLHYFSVPALAAGYVCLMVLMLHSGRCNRLMALFGAVGRMALTNYVAQSVLLLLTFSSLGLGLAGRAGPAILLCLALTGFAFQMAMSRLWLQHFSYGPLEWLWRWLTYGRRPQMRVAA